METFTARNGHTLHITPEGSLEGIPSHVETTFREYFQHLRDRELGRWRDPENPTVVVYRKPEWDDEGGRCVAVLFEDTGNRFRNWEHRVIPDTPAARYFAAHPETKPWHNPKPATLWTLTIDDEPVAALATDWGTFAHLCVGHGEVQEIPCNHPDITHAERIWPKED